MEDINKKELSEIDITWLKDKSLAYLDNFPDPDVLAEEIIENLEASLLRFKLIVDNLNQSKV